MSAFTPFPGTEFYLSGLRMRVESYHGAEGYIIAADDAGTLTTLTIEHLVHHPHLAMPDEPKTVLNLTGTVDENDRRIAMLRIAEVREAFTGYRSGNPDEALAGEPRPQYDPATQTQEKRFRAKVAELDTPSSHELGLFMSYSTIRRVSDAIRHGNAVTFALGKHRPRRSAGRRAMKPEFETAARDVIAWRKRGSTVTEQTLFFNTKFAVAQQKGIPWVKANAPSFATWRRWVHDRYTKSQITGKASTRGSATEAPPDGFNPAYLTRQGQEVHMDTNNLDVLLKGTALQGVIDGSLIVAIDAFSLSCCALRVVEKSETAVDTTMTLLDIARPVAMRPDWDDRYRWPFVGLPERVVATIGGIKTGVAGMPVLNPEAVVVDHGNTYKSNKFRDALKRIKTDPLPARVRTGSDKHPVERFFGAAATMILNKLGGYRGSNTAERGADTEETAEWTAQRLEEFLLEWVILVWQTHIIDGHKPPWCPEGDWSPNDLYQLGITVGGFCPRLMSQEDYYSVLRPAQVRIQPLGVNVNGLWYDEPILSPWRQQPAPNGSKKWTVLADERDLRVVYWVDADGARQRLRWRGNRGNMPAFSKSHVKALRRRLGDLTRHDSDEIAIVLLESILKVSPPPGEQGSGERKQDVAASRHHRDLELADRDRAQAGITTTRDEEAAPDTPEEVSPNAAPNATPERAAPPGTAHTGRADNNPTTRNALTAAERHQTALEEARRARRRAATQATSDPGPASPSGSEDNNAADAADDVAEPLGLRRLSLLGDLFDDDPTDNDDQRGPETTTTGVA